VALPIPRRSRTALRTVHPSLGASNGLREPLAGLFRFDTLPPK